MIAIARRKSIALRVVRAALRVERAALLAWLVVSLLAACQHSMTASFGGATRASSGGGASSPGVSPGPSVADTVPAPEYAEDPVVGPMGDTATLIGTTVDEATRLAREKGYAGKIEVLTLSEFQAGCKPATVCRVDPRLWELLYSKILTLYVNRELTITTPN